MGIQLLVNGVAMGCIYALVALGFVILYNATGIINFAQGEVLAVGAYLCFFAFASLGAPLAAALLIGVIAMVAVALALFFAGYYPLKERSVLVGVVGTMGIGIALKNAIHLLNGPLPHTLPPIFGAGQIAFGGASFSTQSLSIIGCAAVMFALFFAFTNYSNVGIRMRAAAQDRDMSSMLGIRVDRTMCITFLVSALISTVAGFLAAPIVLVTPDMGLPLMLKGFIAIVIGGFGSIPGAIVGGMFVGVLETTIAAEISSAYRDVFTFLALIVVLVVRPTGFFGERAGTRV
jgi:branched-chain amino acid transport system permease protein